VVKNKTLLLPSMYITYATGACNTPSVLYRLLSNYTSLL